MKDGLNLKLVSNGMPAGTHLIDIDTGKEISNIAAIDWSIRPNQMADCTINLLDLPVEVIAVAKLSENPYRRLGYWSRQPC